MNFHAAAQQWSNAEAEEFMAKHSFTTTLTRGGLLWIPPGSHVCMMSPEKSLVAVATLHSHEFCTMADDTVMLAVANDILEFLEEHGSHEFISEIKKSMARFARGFKVAKTRDSHQDAALTTSGQTSGPAPRPAAGPAPMAKAAASKSAVPVPTEPCPAVPAAAGPAPPAEAAASKAPALAPTETDIGIDPAASDECGHQVTLATSGDTNSEVPPMSAETATPNLSDEQKDGDVQ